jgi:hypothetical protein
LKIKEIPIPTYYGSEKCHVNLLKYSFNIIKSLIEYLKHKKGIKRYEKFDIRKTKRNNPG